MALDSITWRHLSTGWYVLNRRSEPSWDELNRSDKVSYQSDLSQTRGSAIEVAVLAR